jgi:hypothetical protein
MEIDLAIASPKVFDAIRRVLERVCDLGKNITPAEFNEAVAELEYQRNKLVN